MMTIWGAVSGKIPSWAALGCVACLAVATILAVGAVGCDDPYAIDWEESPDTAFIYSMARPELNLPSAYDFVGNLPLRVEAPLSTGQWDLALDTQGGELVFLPPGALGVYAFCMGRASRSRRTARRLWRGENVGEERLGALSRSSEARFWAARGVGNGRNRRKERAKTQE